LIPSPSLLSVRTSGGLEPFGKILRGLSSSTVPWRGRWGSAVAPREIQNSKIQNFGMPLRRFDSMWSSIRVLRLQPASPCHGVRWASSLSSDASSKGVKAASSKGGERHSQRRYGRSSNKHSSSRGTADLRDNPSGGRLDDPIVSKVLGKYHEGVDNNQGPGSRLSPPKMQLVTLGTGSMAQTKTRNVSASALTFGRTAWLFDCGETTQTSVRSSCDVRLGAISRIYITHLHGDHFFGLPSLMCAMCEPAIDAADHNTRQRKNELPPLEIFGPPNLRIALRTMLLASGVHFPYKYVVTELHPYRTPVSKPEDEVVHNTLHPCEILGPNIRSNEYNVWDDIPTVFPPNQHDPSNVAKICAARVRHSQNVPCIGYVIEERSYPGSLDGQRVKQILRQPENRELFNTIGVRDPLRSLRYLKSGYELKLPTGLLKPEDMIGPSKPGRKVVILGDTCDASNIAGLAANADVLLHESTNAYLPALTGAWHDERMSKALLDRTLSHGHSTPQLAGAFAEAIGAKSLILTHFSSRYVGMIPERYPITREMLRVSNALQASAKETFRNGDVFISNDLERFDIFGAWHESRTDTNRVLKSSYESFVNFARKVFESSEEESVDLTLRLQGFRPSSNEIEDVYKQASRIISPDLKDTDSFASSDDFDFDFLSGEEDVSNDSEDMEESSDGSSGSVDDSDDDLDAPEDEEVVPNEVTSSSRNPLTPGQAAAAARHAIRPHMRILRKKRFLSRIIYHRTSSS